ncbi:MAG: hypothetical protein FJ272_05395 [Planctomycetes bacterium]|nr:hypothetical protein [Planctomycetota bacterium]
MAQPAVLGGRREAAEDDGASANMRILDTRLWRIRLQARLVAEVARLQPTVGKGTLNSGERAIVSPHVLALVPVLGGLSTPVRRGEDGGLSY